MRKKTPMKEASPGRWYWYAAHDDELMMDCDGRHLLEIALKRLERSLETTKTEFNTTLQVRSTFVSHSQNSEHYHFIVRLSSPMDILERIVWQLYFMDHVYRSVKNLFRALDGVKSPSLLISPIRWPYWINESTFCREMPSPPPEKCFWRKPDATCSCPLEKHKSPIEIVKCPAHIKLRGVS